MPNWVMFLPILAAGTTLFPLTATTLMEAKPDLAYMPLLLKRCPGGVLSIPSKNTYNDMLECATRYNIHPLLEREPMSTQGIENLTAKT